ncbi:MAG: Hsp20/alpha crystallin family protein [Nanoarchaeota archaeon]|nr:Hsp20/alpha crystallin family protein [Nanoarchaeota archaeon]
MGFFEDDDQFENIIREFLGGRTSRIRKGNYEEIIESEREERVVDFIEDESYVYLIFELPGYSEKDISISIKGRELEIIAKKRDIEGIPNYLMEKFNNGFFIKKNLPNFIKTKNFKHTVKNGVLEIVFIKK